MAISVDAVAERGAGGPGLPGRPLAVSPARTRRRLRLDRWASRLVVVGGLIIIAAILAILFVIVAEVYPLFRTPTVRLARSYRAAEPAPAWQLAGSAGLGVDEYREIAYGIDRRGLLRLVSLKDGRALPPVPIPGLDGAEVSAVASTGQARHALGTSDGRVIPLEMKFEVTFRRGERVVTPQPVFGEPFALDPAAKRRVRALVFAAPDSAPLAIGQVGAAELAVLATAETKALIGPGTREESRQTLNLQIDGEVTQLALDGRAEDLFIGTSRGQVARYDLRDQANPGRVEVSDVTARPGVAVTALGFLIGDRTLVVGDRSGGVSTWQVVPPPGGGERRLTRVHQFEPQKGAVLDISASKREKGFATADATGEVHLNYGTSGQTLLSWKATSGPLRSVAIAPKADGILTLDDTGTVTEWRLDNPHPEITWRTLFGKVWYEGYSRPEYVWQSTGGTDDFEAKFSLTPLIYGTLKGTFYALLIAVPLALLAAVYVSEFMHPGLKAYVKPVVEIMAALPSVVLGFLAGLWLAPMVERIVPGLFLVPLVLPVVIVLALLTWQVVPIRIRGRVKAGTEVFLLVPVVVAGLWLALGLGGLIEAVLLGGNYRGWLLSALGLTYDQRNSLVVGIAMGFAVIPIIFTIAEDSLANVPGHLRAGSLALGANRWQTALRIVLPTASPGIFSAIMIGFGRAVGETMIVLMATGNTPVMDWSIFNGFRALSANIAVELPEAPEQGTLYRVLFLAALLLFGLTFVLNTAAELVRLKLRRKYRYL
ncbi:MAG TPA: ABC transporter permease subunit [Methylomirabilota bacterium]|jgi:phosphate transport system permease protein|nr:ABC transporter permease subunit [Methylomirabilota bacterium]